MGELSDILRGGESGREGLFDDWNAADAAEDFQPLPSGKYIASIESGVLSESSRKGTPSYKLTFRITEGEYKDRLVWHDIWLTEKARPIAKRDLGKLGVTGLEQLEKPMPQGIKCEVTLALRKGDGGVEYNQVRRFDVIDMDEPEPNPFTPVGEPEATGDRAEGAATSEPPEWVNDHESDGCDKGNTSGITPKWGES